MSSGNVYAPIAALLETNPHGALTALDQLAGPDRETRQAWDLRARGLHLLGRQHAAYGDADNALACWHQALRCDDAAIQGQVCLDIEDLCQRTAWALAQGGRVPEALGLLQRGLSMVQSPRLAALRDQLAPAPAAPVPPPPRAARAAGPRTSRTVAFNALTLPARRRFVACASGTASPAPLNVEKRAGTGGSVVGLLLATVALAGFGAFGFAEAGDSFQSPVALIGYGVLLFLVAMALFGIVRGRIIRSRLPYTPGAYLFPADIVVADEGGTLRVLPLRELAEFKCVHHSTNRRYTHSVLHFKFQGGATHDCVVSPMARAEAVLQQLSDAQRRQAQAAAAGDAGAIDALDPLSATATVPGPSSSPTVEPVPGWVRWRAALACAVALLLVVPVWALRNVFSDYVLFNDTERQGTEAAYRQYAGQGWLFVARARERLPFLAFAEAKRKGTVTALRAVLHNYPGSPVESGVRGEVRAAYEKSRAKFRAQAVSADPRMLAFMEKLVDYLEGHDLSAVAVRFRIPNPVALTAEDQRLSLRAAGAGRQMAPIAPHFTDKSARPREAAIVDQLNKGFASIFPADVLALAMGPRLTETGPVPTDVPAILIDYEVAPSGMIYQSQTSVLGKLFVGIKVSFKVSMRVPGSPPPFDFSLDVAPPQHFSVEYEKSGPMSDFMGPPDERVYAVMAARAFDELSSKLRGAFFPPAATAAKH